MDNTETYIKMADCPEIQGLWKPQEGDCCVERKYLDIPLFLLEDLRGWGFITARQWEEDDAFVQHKSIWLPYQHQLQDMVKDNKRANLPRWLALDFNRWLITPFAYPCVDFSMEQLWLNFVMYDKFNKTWNGEDWI